MLFEAFRARRRFSPYLLWEFVKDLFGHQLATGRGREDHAAFALEEFESGFGDEPFHLLEDELTGGVDIGDHGVTAFGVFWRLERLGKSGRELGDQGLDMFAELDTTSRGQPDRERAAIVLEIVDEAEVRRARLGGGALLQVFMDESRAAGAGQAECEEVESRAGDVEAELERGDGTGLSDHLAEGREVGCRLEAESTGIAPAVQLVGPELFRESHAR